MSSASTSPHGFVTVRGRGYRPEQVDAHAAGISRARDAAWERAARLTVLVREMEEAAQRLRATVAGLAPQTYESLGERAAGLFRLGIEEAAAVRERARREAEEHGARAQAHAQDVRRAAREEADALRADAEERARVRSLTARAEADDLRVSARRAVKESRAESLAALREVRLRTSAMLADRAAEHAERWAGAEREEAGRTAAFEARYAEAVTRAEAEVSAAKRAFGAAEESARRTRHEAHARAAGILAAARLHEDRIARDTEQLLRDHGETWDQVQAQLDQVRGSLAALTGRAVPERAATDAGS
ncbi:cellulose-binding protein [Streptomyces sp. NPDC026672]|uniref:cellulose-binding protein n=1 Tax=unclassified Streptomyces TaxID=2593676 RepID=UPI0033E3E427